ncbi:MAG: AI-2E family transporter [Rhizobiaceae bacterium]
MNNTDTGRPTAPARRNTTDEPRLFGPASSRIALVAPLTMARWLLVLIAAAGIYFFHGFLVPVLAALIVAFASWPLYRRLLRRVNFNRTVAASLATFAVVAFLVVPIAIAGAYAVHEIQIWIGWAIEANRNGAPTPEWIVSLPLVGERLDALWAQYIGHPGAIGQLVQLISGDNIGGIYRAIVAFGGSAFNFILALVFMLIALFFAYRDGESFVAQLDTIGERIFPTRWERISRVVPATISATVTGQTLIAIGEGIVLGVAYWLAGLPSPVTFGLITGFLALIPGGAPLSMTLASIYLAASGSLISGLALFIWGTVELFVVDKTIRPKLVGGPIKLPFLPTFFGLIGGVKTMGLVGLFVGPVLMALIVAIWREWVHETAAEPVPAVVPEAPETMIAAGPEPTRPAPATG